MVMTNPPVDEHGDTDREADAMKDQLRKDVANWSKARAEETMGQSVRLVAPDLAPASRPASRAPRAKVKAPDAVKDAVPAVKQPFKMGYDGTTDRDFIGHRIRLGAR